MKKDFIDIVGEILLWTAMAGMVLCFIFGKLLGMITLGGIFIAIALSTLFIYIAAMVIDDFIESIKHKNSNK